MQAPARRVKWPKYYIICEVNEPPPLLSLTLGWVLGYMVYQCFYPGQES